MPELLEQDLFRPIKTTFKPIWKLSHFDKPSIGIGTSFGYKNNPMTIEFACRYNLDENNSLKSQLWVYIMLPNLKKERYATLGYKITSLSSKEILNKLTILKGF